MIEKKKRSKMAERQLCGVRVEQDTHWMERGGSGPHPGSDIHLLGNTEPIFKQH